MRKELKSFLKKWLLPSDLKSSDYTAAESEPEPSPSSKYQHGKSKSPIVEIKNDQSLQVKAKALAMRNLRQRKAIQHPSAQQALRDESPSLKVNDLMKTSVMQELKCAVCLGLIIRPAVAGCGHTFCLKCLDQATLFQENCPVCRKKVSWDAVTICQQTAALVQAVLKHTKCQNCLRRVAEEENWLQMRSISSIDVAEGDFLDFKDIQDIWCQVKVVRIFKQQSQVLFLLHYLDWNDIYDEIAPSDSIRLARLRFYTGRKGIPRYLIAHKEGVSSNSDSQDNTLNSANPQESIQSAVQ